MIETEIKATVRHRDGYKCVDCGMTREEHFAKYRRKLEVHRIIAGSVYAVEGCVTLCKKCHKGRHRKPQRVRYRRMIFDCPKDIQMAVKLRMVLDGKRSISQVITEALESYLPRELAEADEAMQAGNPPPKPRRGRKPSK